MPVFAEPLIRALDLFLDDPDEFVRRLPKIESNPILGNLSRSADGTFRVNIDPIQFSSVANSFCSEGEFPHSLAFFALDNLNSHCGVPKSFVGVYGFYGFSSNLLQIPRQGGWLASAALGYRHFTSAYRSRILEIQFVDSQGDISTGTGFFLRSDDGRSRIVTCGHNLLEKSGRLRRIESARTAFVPVLPRSGILLDRIDIAVFDTDVQGLDLPNARAEILETVYSAGYPRIYMTKSSPLLFHRGEVNGFSGSIDDASKEIILSIDVAPGNSGGPIFNEVGCVVGVISRKTETASISGMASYAHAIPIEVIMSELAAKKYCALSSL